MWSRERGGEGEGGGGGGTGVRGGTGVGGIGGGLGGTIVCCMIVWSTLYGSAGPCAGETARLDTFCAGFAGARTRQAGSRLPFPNSRNRRLEILSNQPSFEEYAGAA